TTDLADAKKAAADNKPMWIDLGDQTTEVMTFLTEALGLHPLTLEDIWTDRPSPKVDEFPEYVYVCAHCVKRDKDGEIQTCEVDLVVGKSFVVTHDTQALVTAGVREEILRTPRLLQKGAAWVAHAVLDRLVDGYLPVIDAIDADVEALEDDVLAKAGTPEGGP